MEFLIYALLILGLLGSFIPILPGPLISAAGLLLTGLYDQPLFWVWLSAGVLVFALDYIIPAWFTKISGGSKAGSRGAFIGMLLGIVFTPIGMIIGLLLGAFIGEMLARQNEAKALRSALFALLGFVTGVALKASYAIAVGVWVLRQIG